MAFALRGLLTLDNTEFQERLRESESDASRFAGRIGDVTERSTAGFRKLAGAVTGLIAPVALVAGAVVGLAKAFDAVFLAGERQQREMSDAFASMSNNLASVLKTAQDLRRELAGIESDRIGDAFGGQRESVQASFARQREEVLAGLSESELDLLQGRGRDIDVFNDLGGTAARFFGQVLGDDQLAVDDARRQLNELHRQEALQIAAISQEEAKAREDEADRLAKEKREKEQEHQKELQRIAERAAAEAKAAAERARQLGIRRDLFLLQSDLAAAGGDDALLRGEIALRSTAEQARQLGIGGNDLRRVLGNTLAAQLAQTEGPDSPSLRGVFGGTASSSVSRSASLVAPTVSATLREHQATNRALEDIKSSLGQIVDELTNTTPGSRVAVYG